MQTVILPKGWWYGFRNGAFFATERRLQNVDVHQLASGRTLVNPVAIPNNILQAVHPCGYIDGDLALLRGYTVHPDNKLARISPTGVVHRVAPFQYQNGNFVFGGGQVPGDARPNFFVMQGEKLYWLTKSGGIFLRPPGRKSEFFCRPPIEASFIALFPTPTSGIAALVRQKKTKQYEVVILGRRNAKFKRVIPLHTKASNPFERVCVTYEAVFLYFRHGCELLLPNEFI